MLVKGRFERLKGIFCDVTHLPRETIEETGPIYSHAVEPNGLCSVGGCTSDDWDRAVATISIILYCSYSKVGDNFLKDFPCVYDYIPFTASLLRIELKYLELFPIVMLGHAIYFLKIACLDFFKVLNLANGSWTPQLATVVQQWLYKRLPQSEHR